jgi:hypothetical protein
MDVPEDMERNLPTGELLPEHDTLWIIRPNQADLRDDLHFLLSPASLEENSIENRYLAKCARN